MFYSYGIATWFLILIAAVLNGTARDFLYRKRVGEHRSQQISTVTLILLIFLITYAFLRIGDFDASQQQLWTLGTIWVLMTAAFEFLFFHYVGKHSWRQLLENYKFWKGRLWILVLIATLIAPRLMTRLLQL